MGLHELLCVGDVHLGRRPGRVPDDLEGIEARALTPRAAFEAVVDEALAREVRAVLFVGDVVDAEDHFLEAYSVLEEGVGRLVRAGIEAIAVAGNHDVRALPRLADEVEGFRLLGRGGRWEQHLLRGAGGEPLARLVGWSFPRAQVTSSPLAELPALALERRTDVPTLALLHCDLDQHGGTYAPVARRDLEAVEAVDAWLLGHVHAPSWEQLARPRPVGYLGSLCGLDPSETGVHGPWRLTLEGGRAFALEQRPLAPLAWVAIDVPVDGLEDAEELDALLTRALRDHAAREEARLGAARAVGCRLRMVGRSPVHHALLRRARALVEGGALAELRSRLDGRLHFVDKLVDESRPALALEELARTSDPPGLLARKLLALERREPAGESLVGEARRRMEELSQRKPWSSLGSGAPAADVVRAHLLRAGEQALEELLAQQEARA